MQGRQLTTDKILVRSGHLIGLTSATRCLETSELQMYLLVTVKHAQNAKNWQCAYSTRVCVYSQEHETGPGTRLKRGTSGLRRQQLDLGLEAGAAELVHLLDVLLHGVLLRRTLALGPLIKLGLGLLVEETTGPGCGLS